jgi:hypothetical protein
MSAAKPTPRVSAVNAIRPRTLARMVFITLSY